MIRHIVLVRFRDNVTLEDKQSIFDQLANLKSQINGMIDFKSGPNISPEQEFTRGYQELFWVDFDSLESRDEYLAHPAHAVAGQRLLDHLQGDRDGIIVTDIEF